MQGSWGRSGLSPLLSFSLQSHVWNQNHFHSWRPRPEKEKVHPKEITRLTRAGNVLACHVILRSPFDMCDEISTKHQFQMESNPSSNSSFWYINIHPLMGYEQILDWVRANRCHMASLLAFPLLSRTAKIRQSTSQPSSPRDGFTTINLQSIVHTRFCHRLSSSKWKLFYQKDQTRRSGTPFAKTRNLGKHIHFHCSSEAIGWTHVTLWSIDGLFKQIDHP